ncbi:MAG TPA: hypothetical protein VMW53_08415 [archaeon]|nr:hypothetical protein [archaeon]
MKHLDEMLESLQDSNLNDCQSIKERLAFSNDEFHEVIIFLQKQQMIELNNNKIRITSKGKTFLALPH